MWSLDALGVSRDHGPILPGLRDYDAAKTFRHHSAFDRFTTPRFEAYLPPYACRVADLVESERGQRPVQIQVVMTAKRIRFLNEIRAGGGTTFDQVWSSEPFEVADCID